MQRSWRPCCFLAYFLWLDLPGFIKNQDHQSRYGTNHKELGPPSSMIKYETPYRVVYSPILRWCFLNWGSFLPDELSLFKLTQYLIQHKRKRNLFPNMWLKIIYKWVITDKIIGIEKNKSKRIARNCLCLCSVLKSNGHFPKGLIKLNA